MVLTEDPAGSGLHWHLKLWRPQGSLPLSWFFVLTSASSSDIIFLPFWVPLSDSAGSGRPTEHSRAGGASHLCITKSHPNLLFFLCSSTTKNYPRVCAYTCVHPKYCNSVSSSQQALPEHFCARHRNRQILKFPKRQNIAIQVRGRRKNSGYSKEGEIAPEFLCCHHLGFFPPNSLQYNPLVTGTPVLVVPSSITPSNGDPCSPAHQQHTCKSQTPSASLTGVRILIDFIA